jgi:streptogramin lyase
MRSIIVLLCIVTVCGVLAVGQSAEWTVWNMPSDESFPGDLVWMVDNSLFVALHDPQALARFEPDANRLIAWVLPVSPSEFVWTNSGLFFTTQRDSGIGWLQPDANHFEVWALPSPTAEPIFLRESSFGKGVENLWYLEWELGRLGLFEPTQLSASFEEGTEPLVIPVTQTSRSVVALSETVVPVISMGTGDFAPATYLISPIETGLFREWGLVTMDPPAYALAEDGLGNIWVPDAVNGTLLSLSPTDERVSIYELPDAIWLGGLVAIPDSTDIYFSAFSESDGVSKIGLLQSETGNVALWDIPGGREIDAVSLITMDGDLWFCDRGNSAVYRFDLVSGTFTWWVTGGDDSPLYIVPGYPGEFWVSWEWSGKIARLRLPNE